MSRDLLDQDAALEELLQCCLSAYESWALDSIAGVDWIDSESNAQLGDLAERLSFDGDLALAFLRPEDLELIANDGEDNSAG